ncbi:hypothetical protein JCM8097_007633 [Rhodosporidiobolus ruineniae]
MSDSAELSPAAARAAARREKLLAKGADRLNKITGTAKAEGRVISDSAGIPARPPTSANPPAPTSLADVAGANDDPAEVDLASQNPLSLLAGMNAGGAGGANPFAAFPGLGGAGAEGGAPGGDLFAQMMQQMAAGAGGEGGPGAAAGGGAGGLGAGANPFMMQPPAPPAPKTLLERVFPLVHILAMVGLAVYAVVFLEPARRVAEYGWTGTEDGIDWKAWGALLSQKPREYGAVAEAVGFRQLAEVPLLWMFISTELVLQTTRLFLVRNTSSPPGLIASALPLLSQFSPQLGGIVQTGFRYLDLFTACLNDLAVLIFCIGVVILVGRWKSGDLGLAEVVQEKTNRLLEKAAGEL